MTAPWDQRPADEQARVETLTLSRWLPGVLETVPFLTRRHGSVDQRRLRDRQGLQRLAPTRERDLLSDAPGGRSSVLRPTEDQVKRFADRETLAAVASGIRRDADAGKRDAMLLAYRPVHLHRSGVTSELLIASSRSDLDRIHRAGARAAAVLGLVDEDVVLSAIPAGPTLPALATTHLAYGASLTALHARGVGTGMDDVAAAAGLLQPTVLVVALDEAIPVAAAMAEWRVDARRLRRVVTFGPPPHPDRRARIEDAYRALGARADVRAVWAPGVGRSLWAECAEGAYGLHTTPDLEVLEVLDPLSGRSTDGDGDLTLTTAGWHGTVLVRFQTGAWVDPLTTDPCPGCRRTVPRLVGDIAPHAWELPVTLDGGRRGHVDLRGVAAVLADLPGVRAWRAELRGPTTRVPRDRLVVELSGDPSQADRYDLDRRIEEAVGLVPHIVDGLPREEIEQSIAEFGGQLADRR